VALQLDTGSSDVWMFGPKACAAVECEQTGVGFYNSSKSSTYKLITANGFEIQYVTPGSEVKGDYFSDVFTVGDLTVKNLTMAVANNASAVETGIMGIGFASDESIVGNGGPSYPSVIDDMVTQGVIGSHSYSLWLDDANSSTGTILFGGYDTGKYIPPLTVLDLQADATTKTITSFTVVWSMLALTDSTGSTLIGGSEFPLPAVLDSGTTLMAIPPSLFVQVAEYFGVTADRYYGYIVPCNIGGWNGTLDFGFGSNNGPIIQVLFSELVIPLTDEQGQPLQFNNGQDVCMFGVQPTPAEGIYLLGDTFLRSAYVVYDLDAKQVAIAQAKWDSDESNVLPIASGTALGALLSSASSATGATVTASGTGHVAPGNSMTKASENTVTATETGSVSHIAGERTSLSLQALPTTTHTGSTQSTASATTSAAHTGAASSSRPLSGSNGFSLLTAFVAVAAGGLLVAFRL